MNTQRLLTRAALILALTLVFQSLRLVIPLPPLFSTFLIGTLVNACLLVAVETVGLVPAAVIAVVAPVAAYLQQMLLLPVFIIPVAIGNFLLVAIYKGLISKGRMVSIGLAAFGKTGFLFAAFSWMLTFVNINPKLSASVLFVMSWPQLVTAILGGVLATLAMKRIRRWEEQ